MISIQLSYWLKMENTMEKPIPTSSVFKKQILALSGLCLCAFLIVHLAGNCLIYLGSDPFNSYAHTLMSNPFIYVAEAALAFLFLLHIGLAIHLVIENHQARPHKYYMKVHTGRGANMASASMPYTGVFILIFLIIHLINFKFGPMYFTISGEQQIRDLYRLVMEYFSDPFHVFWYICAMCCLGIHLSHGLWSAFQSLGITSVHCTPLLKSFSKFFGIAMTLGYSLLPIFCYMKGNFQ